MPWHCLRGFENRVRSFFTDHVDGARNEKARDARKDGSVDDADATGSVHTEIAGEDAAGTARTNRAGGGRVMAPGVLAHEASQLSIVFQICSRRLFVMNDSQAPQSFRHLPNATNPFDDSSEIVAVLVGSFLEIVKIDERRIARIT
jgi:hypothetical protein